MAPDTIFVLAVVSRGGSNFGRMVVCQHPAVCPTDIHEDFLLLHSKHLLDYVEGCHRTRGEQAWSNRDELLCEVARGALRSLRRKIAPHFTVATRSPTVKGLDNLPVFPQSRALVLVRDPRDCVESSQVSFGRSPEYVTSLWTENMRIVEQMRSHASVSVFRYEDLVNGSISVQRVFEGLGLTTNVPIPDVSKLPVLGSSDLVRQGGPLHWRPTAPTTDFKPIGRWKHREAFWCDFIKKREALAATMAAWGYI